MKHKIATLTWALTALSLCVVPLSGCKVRRTSKSDVREASLSTNAQALDQVAQEVIKIATRVKQQLPAQPDLQASKLSLAEAHSGGATTLDYLNAFLAISDRLSTMRGTKQNATNLALAESDDVDNLKIRIDQLTSLLAQLSQVVDENGKVVQLNSADQAALREQVAKLIAQQEAKNKEARSNSEIAKERSAEVPASVEAALKSAEAAVGKTSRVMPLKIPPTDRKPHTLKEGIYLCEYWDTHTASYVTRYQAVTEVLSAGRATASFRMRDPNPSKAYDGYKEFADPNRSGILSWGSDYALAVRSDSHFETSRKSPWPPFGQNKGLCVLAISGYLDFAGLDYQAWAEASEVLSRDFSRVYMP